jgi:two-component system LytT family response regulator
MLVLSEAHRFLVLRHHEIDWARAEGRWTTVYCIDRTHTVHRSLAAFERLLDPTQFVRIHRSMIVRLDRVREMFPGFNGDYDVILHNGTRLQLTRTYVRQFLARTATAEGAIGK